MQLITIAAMLFAACGVIFALQNNVPVTVAFLLWQFESSLAMVVLLTLAAGGFIVALVSTPATLRRQWTVARQNKRIAELESISSSQKETIAGLQSRLPVIETPPAENLPYVGLRQIIGSLGSGDEQDSTPQV